MAKETKGEYKEFRTLLRRGIGTKTQKAFAEEIDISKEHLNRLLNNREISRPSIGLLKKMAAHMQTITERMLLESCGYEIEPIEERAKRCEKQIAQGLQTLISMDHSRPWKSIEDALQTIELLHIEENGKLNLNMKKIVQRDIIGQKRSYTLLIDGMTVRIAVSPEQTFFIPEQRMAISSFLTQM